jgi:hypothetical protein
MTEPSAIATGPSGNRNPVAITRKSAIAPSSPQYAPEFCRRDHPSVKQALRAKFGLNHQLNRQSPFAAPAANQQQDLS